MTYSQFLDCDKSPNFPLLTNKKKGGVIGVLLKYGKIIRGTKNTFSITYNGKRYSVIIGKRFFLFYAFYTSQVEIMALSHQSDYKKYESCTVNNVHIDFIEMCDGRGFIQKILSNE